MVNPTLEIKLSLSLISATLYMLSLLSQSLPTVGFSFAIGQSNGHRHSSTKFCEEAKRWLRKTEIFLDTPKALRESRRIEMIGRPVRGLGFWASRTCA